MNVPERGDIIVIDFDPQAGHEQMKRRPALVLSPSAFNEVFGLAFVAPVTSKPRGHAFEVPLDETCNVTGVAMIHHTKSLDWRARNATYVGKASERISTTAAKIVKEIVN